MGHIFSGPDALLHCARVLEELADEIAGTTQIDQMQTSQENTLRTSAMLLRQRSSDPAPLSTWDRSRSMGQGVAIRDHLGGVTTSPDILQSAVTDANAANAGESSDQGSKRFSGISGAGDTAAYLDEMKRRMRDRLILNDAEPAVSPSLHLAHLNMFVNGAFFLHVCCPISDQLI